MTMKRSSDRILTTQVGSLPRSDDLLRMIQEKDEGRPYDPQRLAAKVRSDVAGLVRHQVQCGLDIVGDGEQSKSGFSSYFGDWSWWAPRFFPPAWPLPTTTSR